MFELKFNEPGKCAPYTHTSMVYHICEIFHARASCLLLAKLHVHHMFDKNVLICRIDGTVLGLNYYLEFHKGLF